MVMTATVTTEVSPARTAEDRTAEDGTAEDRTAEDRTAERARRGYPEQALLLVGGVVAAWLLARQVRRTDPATLLTEIRPGWAAVAAALVAASFVGAALNLMGFATVRLRFAPTVGVQVAGGFVKVVSPAAVGAALVNARYLHRAGASRAQVAGSIGAAQLVQFLATVAVLAGLTQLPGSPLTLSTLAVRTGSEAGVVAVVAVGVVVLLAGAVRCGRRHPRVAAALAVARRELTVVTRHAADHPGQVAMGVTGSLVLMLAFSLGLASSVRAFGGHPDLLTLTVVFLAGSAAGSIVPTPGGLGTVEAALVTGLVATGVAPSVALPAVLWFRLLSVWLPVPIGWVAVQVLRRRDLL